jgi:organic hydroperoxide reductase OsmC/OhrA
MRKPTYIILLLIASAFSAVFGQVQVSVADSFKKLIAQSPDDTTKVLLLAELAGTYQFLKLDTAIVLAR